MVYIKMMKSKFICWFKKEKKFIFASLAIGFTAALTFAAYEAAAYSDKVLEDVAGSVLRFHVLANSDLPEDQALKMSVRDGVLENLGKILTGDESLADTKALLSGRLAEIELWASDIIKSYGAGYSVKASVAQSYFPTRTYESLTLPAGNYEALRIEIGEAEGRNWWCVMFPPLCFVDAAMGYGYMADEPGREFQKAVSGESYRIITEPENVKVKFKIVEIWQELKNFLFHE